MSEIANHSLVDLREVSPDFLHQFGAEPNEDGTSFRCSLKRCTQPHPPDFATQEDIDQHIREDVLVNVRSLACVCKERFSSRSDCLRHVQSKNHPGGYTCSVTGCEKKFGRMDAFQQHTRACHYEYNKA